MAETNFDPTIRNTGWSTEKYIEHLKVVHEMSEKAGIPIGADALFGKSAAYAGNGHSTANKAPSEHIENLSKEYRFAEEREREREYSIKL